MALDYISDYVSQARILLVDTVQPYRYADADLIMGFNIAAMESRRLRPDMWLGVTALPVFYTAAAAGEPTGQTTINLQSIPSQLATGMYLLDVTAGAIPVGATITNILPLTNQVQITATATQIFAGDALSFSATNTVPVDQQYRMAFAYYMVGNATMRDQEETEDSRAALFMKLFHDTLVGGA